MAACGSIIRLYQSAFPEGKKSDLLKKLQEKHNYINNIQVELCYHVETDSELKEQDLEILKWILKTPLEISELSNSTNLKENTGNILIEIGPRFNFSTSNSTNAVSICRNLGLQQVVRLEVSRRFLISHDSTMQISKDTKYKISTLLHDKMTECIYTPENIPKQSFNEKLVKKENIYEVDVLNLGKKALQAIDAELGLAFDEADLDYYTNLFRNVLKRNPTNVECFDLAQSNSEHSRHWFFKGKMIIDGEEYEESLIDMIIKTQDYTNKNNVIKFSDNSR